MVLAEWPNGLINEKTSHDATDQPISRPDRWTDRKNLVAVRIIR
jgi:hypothetical protein